MMARLLLLFIGVPLIELSLLLTVGRRIGVVPTLLVILVTGALGAFHARRQGFVVLARFQEALAQGRLPHRELVEGLLVLVAAAFLLTPGFLTDAAGFALLVPALRARVAAFAAARLREHFHVTASGDFAAPPPGSGPQAGSTRTRRRRGPVIEAEWLDEDGSGPP
jgi:UPF0716 protein FxsA